MQSNTSRSHASLPNASANRYVPIIPAMPTHRLGGGHYVRQPPAERLRSQSESSASDSEEESSTNASSETSESGDDSRADDTDSDTSDAYSSSSTGSRNLSQSSLYGLDDSDASDDGITVISNRLHRYESNNAMSLNAPPARAFWQTDNLGVVALLIPITGISTMLLTEVMACYYHFDCSKHYPTLSYAAEFKPEGHAFTIGMCMTAIFILASIALFHWFLRLRLLHPAVDRTTLVITHSCLTSGAIAAGSLFGLAVMDMGAYHDAHIIFTVLFFIFAWVTMIAVQSARRRLLREDEAAKLDKPTSASTCGQVSGVSAIQATLRRWKRMNILTAYKLGRILLYAGLSATGLFAMLFLCVNGMLPNPFGFTAVQEALLEAFSIVCQLFFMGTLSCELSMLTRVVEHRDYQELERAE